MTTITIVIQNAPYKENNKAWHALRFAGAALAEDMMPGIECGSMKALANRVKHSNHVMVF